ncbi:MAG: HNH endonuclease [Anaerolineae bacterium]|nr:HNH endonuclease [Anaerolineae bacterium]
MSKPIRSEARRLVYDRAQGCCEYCQTCEVNSGQVMQVDHIDPEAGDTLDNLCLACWSCNNYKRQATTAEDPETAAQVPLYNPRTQDWADHFAWEYGATWVRGLTATGRATVMRLKMNRPTLVQARQRWVKSGYHPPRRDK